MSRVITKLIIAAGVLSLLAALALFTYSRVDDYLAGLRAQRLLERVMSGNWGRPDASEPSTQDTRGIVPPLSSRPSERAEEDLPDDLSAIGILEIPALDKRFPVLDRCTSALLYISVCRYTGSMEDKPVRLVITGHNYASHFGQISTLSIGDDIYFITMSGETYHYRMIGIEGCHMNDIDAVQAGSDWDITLLTCQRDRSMRTLVRFREIVE